MKKPKKRILYIQPSIDDAYIDGVDMTYKNIAPSTGLALLACETEKRSICEIYCEICMEPKIDEEFYRYSSRFDIIALSTWFTNYENCLIIAKGIKTIDSDILVVIGGQNASNLGSRILLNRQYIDYVVVCDGEDSLWRIINNYEPAQIPNLWYRENGFTKFTFLKSIDINSVSVWDFRHYQKNSLRVFDSYFFSDHYNHSLPPVGLSITRGCARSALSKGRCDYCSLPLNGYRSTDPEKVWSQINHLKNRYNVSHFFETGDDFVNTKYIKSLISKKPDGTDIALRVYANPIALNEECIDALSDLGVYEVFLGLETADEQISKRVGHVSLLKQTEFAISTLQKKGITVCLPFLFGLPGENLQSIKKTSEYALELIRKYSNIRMVLISLAIPLAGSNWFNSLCSCDDILDSYKETTGDDLRFCDVIDYRVLHEFSLRQEGDLSHEDLIDAMNYLRANLSEKVTVGCFGGIERYKKK